MRVLGKGRIADALLHGTWTLADGKVDARRKTGFARRDTEKVRLSIRIEPDGIRIRKRGMVCAGYTRRERGAGACPGFTFGKRCLHPLRIAGAGRGGAGSTLSSRHRSFGNTLHSFCEPHGRAAGARARCHRGPAGLFQPSSRSCGRYRSATEMLWSAAAT